MSKKRCIFVAAILLIGISLVFAFLYFMQVYSFYGNEVVFKIGCAEIDETGKAEWVNENIVLFIDEKENQSYRWYLASVFTDLDLRKTDDVLRDVELVTFTIKTKNGEEKTLQFSYDFYLKKVYFREQNNWYELTNTKEIDEIIGDLLEYALPFSGYSWRGQSTFLIDMPQEFVDYENPTFRYDLYWSLSNKLSSETPDFKSSDFVNTEPTVVQTKEEAIQRAAKELEYKNPIGVAFYDKTCGFWMVEICDYTDEDFASSQAVDSYLFQHTYTVIMNKEGVTLEIYQSVTDLTPLRDKWLERS